MLNYFFIGLILMSTKALLPYKWSFISILMAMAGFAIVWFWSEK